jgi:hypothetical protein
MRFWPRDAAHNSSNYHQNNFLKLLTNSNFMSFSSFKKTFEFHYYRQIAKFAKFKKMHNVSFNLCRTIHVNFCIASVMKTLVYVQREIIGGTGFAWRKNSSLSQPSPKCLKKTVIFQHEKRHISANTVPPIISLCT